MWRSQRRGSYSLIEASLTFENKPSQNHCQIVLLSEFCFISECLEPLATFFLYSKIATYQVLFSQGSLVSLWFLFNVCCSLLSSVHAHVYLQKTLISIVRGIAMVFPTISVSVARCILSKILKLFTACLLVFWWYVDFGGMRFNTMTVFWNLTSIICCQLLICIVVVSQMLCSSAPKGCQL